MSSIWAGERRLGIDPRKNSTVGPRGAVRRPDGVDLREIVHRAVAECLEEAGDDLFTFLRFPKTQWKALRTTNALERINGEFRRRTKTQASLPGQEAVLLLLFGLLRSGHVKLRKIDGWEEMERVEKAA